MDQSTARQLVLISMLLSGGVIIYDVVKHKDKLGPGQSFKAVWSMALLFLLLSILADTAPEVAGPFAGLVALSVLVGREGALGSIVSIGTGTTLNTRAAAPGPSTTTARHPGIQPQ